MNESIKKQTVSSTPQRINNTKKVLKKLESFSETPITEGLVKDIFYIQDLAYEVNK